MQAQSKTADKAWDRLTRSFERLTNTLDRKAGFKPDQPRRPKGTPVGGQWMRDMQFGPTAEETGERMAQAGADFDAFVARHDKEITRVIGGLQALLGALEVTSGAAAVGIGGATVEVGGLGIGIAGVGAWLVWNGYDNTEAGFYALMTGEPKPTSLNKLLRGLGFSGSDADRIELYLGFAGGFGGARAGRAAMEQAARRELARRALKAFDRRTALAVASRSGKSIWSEVDIRLRGDIWEEFDAQRTGFIRSANAKTFDQVSSDGLVAVSNKTVDLWAETYLRTDRRALFNKLKTYVDAAATTTPMHPILRIPSPLARRELHVLLRFGDAVPGQALQLAAIEAYALERGIKLTVEYSF